MNQKDIHLKQGGFILEGKKYTLYEAISYIMSLGFTKQEASKYLLCIDEEK